MTSYEVMTGGYSRLLARAEVTWSRAGDRSTGLHLGALDLVGLG